MCNVRAYSTSTQYSIHVQITDIRTHGMVPRATAVADRVTAGALAARGGGELSRGRPGREGDMSPVERSHSH